MDKPKKKTSTPSTIALNKRVFHDYFIEDHIEAGLILQGWEVKSLRDKRVQLVESYVILKDGEAFVLGMHVTPLPTASTHIQPDPTRTRKLLLQKQQLNKLIGSIKLKGYTVVPTKLYWKGKHAKLEIALAKGKKEHDKRSSEKTRDWNREKSRILRRS